MSQSLVILGAGYTAHFILPLASSRYDIVVSTSRDPGMHLADVPADRRLEFDLSEPATWHTIPSETDLLWCFPAQPLEAVRHFAATADLASRKVVVLGSTSAYDVATQAVDYPPPWIDETAPIDISKLRVQGEEFLQKECGAIVLRVAGIYGPGRNPLDWIKSGRVDSSPKYVNLIHVEDLATVCLAALERGRSGEVYNISDGTPRTWTEICRGAQDRWGIHAAAQREDEVPAGKRITNGKLLALLQSGQQDLRYSDLWSALAQLAATTS